MLNHDMARYVELQRAMGFKFRVQHALLRSFVAFAEAAGDAFVRVDRVLDWAVRAPSSAQRRNRLLTVRRFALAMRAEDARYEIPAVEALGVGAASGGSPISTRRTRSPGWCAPRPGCRPKA
jgi:hypothetical protein